MTKLSINPSEIKNLIDSDYVIRDNWKDLLCENNGYFTSDEFMIFDVNGTELAIYYDLEVSGDIDYISGDYFTSSSTYAEVTNEVISIKKVTLDDYNIELTKELKILFLEVIENNL